MPNHVSHRIVCSGTSTDVAAFKELMVVESLTQKPSWWNDNRDFTPSPVVEFDFNRIIPMPEEINDNRSAGLSDDDSIIVCVAEGAPIPTEGLSGIFFPLTWDRIKKELGHTEASLSSDQDIALEYLRLHPEKEAAGRKAIELIKKYGFSDWYSWSIAHWGTKWNSYNFLEVRDHASFEFMFNTAWSPPIPVLDAVAQKFPDLSFDIKWFDEGWCHAGSGVIGKGSPHRSADDIGCEPDNDLYASVYGEHPDIDYEPWMDDIAFKQRAVSNFVCEDVAAASDKSGVFTLTGSMFSDDCDLDDDQLFHLREHKQYIFNKAMAA
jgi:hypothetical protein